MGHSDRKVALLAGAGDAIGAAVARRFAKEGYVVCIARRNAENSEDLVAELKDAGQAARAFGTDVRDEDKVRQLVEEIESEIGPIEVALFNAGSNVSRPLHETQAKLFIKAWELACFGGFLVGREVTARMLARGRGTMLFTGATASVKGRTGFTAFASAKFGLRGVAQSMARELGPQNIHVAHLIIDAAVDSEAIHQRLKAQGVDISAIEPDSLVNTMSIAEAYWYLHCQTRDGWTHELDLRPSLETW
ncbi:SDR family NAD(P)-dependent oxidoreductase [Seohaeicola saemankumensis]|uniref:SDR family NAD(P)-dependent oxidoreductase n=1 Tax=Seohaeicola TaxID=481178 RepID=UPI0035CE8B7F